MSILKFSAIPFLVTLSMSFLLSCFLFSSESRTFVVEHARTDTEIHWGLMQRRFLPENQGMLFHYPEPKKLQFWSFNCYIDLSIAFIGEGGVIREIKTLKAFPEKMDPARPVLSCADFSLYPPGDPVITFFQKTSVFCSFPVKHVLEMNLGWFDKNKVQVGDVLHWNDTSTSAFFTAE